MAMLCLSSVDARTYAFSTLVMPKLDDLGYRTLMAIGDSGAIVVAMALISYAGIGLLLPLGLH